MPDLLIDQIPSPNHSSRKGRDVVATVIHYTAAGSHRGSIRWFQMPEARASAHFVVARDGHVTQMVDLARKAWHAGNSEYPYQGEMTRDVNKFSVGIELANCGMLVPEPDNRSGYAWAAGRKLIAYRGPQPVYGTLKYDDGQIVDGWWEPYPNAQMDALQALLRHIKAAGYPEAASGLVGHEEVCMPLGWKRDPGPVFPWDRFAQRPVPPRTTAEMVGQTWPTGDA